MMGEEVFQLHVAAPTYATCPKSIYKARQETSPTEVFPCWRATGSSFPAGVQNGPLLCWCLYGSSFPAGTLQIS